MGTEASWTLVLASMLQQRLVRTCVKGLTACHLLTPSSRDSAQQDHRCQVYHWRPLLERKGNAACYAMSILNGNAPIVLDDFLDEEDDRIRKYLLRKHEKHV